MPKVKKIYTSNLSNYYGTVTLTELDDKTYRLTLSENLLGEIINLCHDLDALNPRNTTRDGSVSVGAGRLANWQHITRRILLALTELGVKQQ